MSHTLFELDVRLREIEPPIWRTVQVPGAWSLEDVHYALQIAMGWTNSHLHRFVIGEQSYGMADLDDSGDAEVEDERQHRLQDLVGSGESFVYEYDFGDGWEHAITAKQVTTVSKPPRPRCVAGARACPPEDCGGPGGYAGLLEALADPSHETHEEMAAWAGGFQPEQFALPRQGLDLRDEIEGLKALSEGADPLGSDEGEPEDAPMFDLPRPLVETVLALDPMQRASLVALLAGSLATELVEVTHAADQMATAMRERSQKRAGRAHRKRSRS